MKFSMLLTVAGQLPIHTAFPILSAAPFHRAHAEHLWFDEYIKRTAETQRNFLFNGAQWASLDFCGRN
jgi:hypothetical protein